MKSLEIEEVVVADTIEISNQALAATNNQTKMAEEMIARVNVLWSKAMPVHQTKTARLEEMTTRSIQIHQQKMEKRSALEEIKSRLSKVAIFDREELKSQVVKRA